MNEGQNVTETTTPEVVGIEPDHMDIFSALAKLLNGAIPVNWGQRDSVKLQPLLRCDKVANKNLEWSPMTAMLVGAWALSEGSLQCLSDELEVDSTPEFMEMTIAAEVSVADDGRRTTKHDKVDVIKDGWVIDSEAQWALRIRVAGPYSSFNLHAAVDRLDEASEIIDGVVEKVRANNPWRGQHIHQTIKGLGLSPVAPMSREDLILPDEVWEKVDTNVHGLFNNFSKLAGAGLRSNRGLLLSGAPGVGKTAIGRVLANELRGKVTTIIPDQFMTANNLEDVYQLAGELAPSLVILEDLDLVVGHRRHGGGGSLQGLLLALDGATSNASGVVTIASTNDPEMIDPAARRSARFDCELEILPPSADTRSAIMRSVLVNLGLEVDPPSEAVAATDGLSGSDLTEVVISAFIATDGKVTPESIIRSAVEHAGRAREIMAAADSAYL